MGSRRAIGLLFAILVVGGCGFLPSSRPEWAQCTPNGQLACTTLDGVALGQFGQAWEVGRAPVPCTEDCTSPVVVSRLELERRFPDHPPLIAIHEYDHDRHALCGDTLCTVSGYLGIFVYTFDDGSAVPIVVRCPGVAACRVSEGYGARD